MTEQIDLKDIDLLKKMVAAGQQREIEPDMAAFLVKMRDKLPEDHSTRHMINFHFAAQALHDVLVRENKIMAAAALASFVPQFIKVCAIDAWLSGDSLVPDDADDAEDKK